MVSEDLDSMLGSMDLDGLSDDEKELLKEQALEKWNSINVTEFKQQSNNTIENINNDFNSTRDILVCNINKLEKLTEVIFENISEDTTNNSKIQTGILAISEQNKQLKLLHEIKHKFLQNKNLHDKNNNDIDGKDKKGLPDGLKFK